MATANPLGFVGGMFLEIGAVVAVLWQPQAGDAQQVQQPDFFVERPIRFTTSARPDYGEWLPQPALSPLLPVARYESLSPRLPRVEMARPVVREFRSPSPRYDGSQTVLCSHFREPQLPRALILPAGCAVIIAIGTKEFRALNIACLLAKFRQKPQKTRRFSHFRHDFINTPL